MLRGSAAGIGRPPQSSGHRNWGAQRAFHGSVPRGDEIPEHLDAHAEADRVFSRPTMATHRYDEQPFADRIQQFPALLLVRSESLCGDSIVAELPLEHHRRIEDCRLKNLGGKFGNTGGHQ